MSESGLFLLLPDSPEQEQGVSSRDVLNIPITKQISTSQNGDETGILGCEFFGCALLFMYLCHVTCDFWREGGQIGGFRSAEVQEIRRVRNFRNRLG